MLNTYVTSRIIEKTRWFGTNLHISATFELCFLISRRQFSSGFILGTLSMSVRGEGGVGLVGNEKEKHSSTVLRWTQCSEVQILVSRKTIVARLCYLSIRTLWLKVFLKYLSNFLETLLNEVRQRSLYAQLKIKTFECKVSNPYIDKIVHLTMTQLFQKHSLYLLL